MKYVLVGTINAIYGILLLLTITPTTPGLAIVAIIGSTLTIIGLSGCILYLINSIKQKSEQNPEALNNWFSFTRTFDIVLIIGLLFRALVLQPFVVDGASMETNFHNSEGLLVDKISYHVRDLKRGDVIVFKAPINPKEDYIKRIVGLPGETIKISDGNVYVNNKLLKEPYLNSEKKTYVAQNNNFVTTVGTNEYFVMGDNRSNSSDSREWGNVPKNNIIGKAWIIVYPFSHKGFVDSKNPQIIQ